MAITKVRVKINGVWSNLTLNSSTGKWEGSITAPSVTSYNQTGGYWPVTIEATNSAGTVTTVDATDSTIGEALRLIVKETVKPVIKLVQPSNGAYISNNMLPIIFDVTDEAGGSGVKLSTVALKLAGTTYKDGNAAVKITASYTVDTIPPTLTISEPADGLITNQGNQIIKGVTNDTTSSPVTVTIVHGSKTYSPTVDDTGAFTQAVVLTEGTNTINVTAKDAAGKTTEIMLTVDLDTTVPTVKSVVMSPNPANVSGSVVITLEVE